MRSRKATPRTKSLQRDLASFAIDGGRLVVGIDESAGFALTPVVLKGLADRIDLVAHSRIDEPLDLEVTTIRTAIDPDHGYLVVEVPVSPRAPHMVDNRYWGRTEKGKFPLGDALVTQLIERRKQWAVAPEAALDEWIVRDPIPVADQKLAHLHVVAIPVPKRDGFMLSAFSGDPRTRFTRLVQEAEGIALSGASVTVYGPQLAVGIAWLVAMLVVAARVYRFNTAILVR